jgi:EAL domain-containing protein (putative c-di-GMP-specific phosphodiesterase class I)
MEQRDTLDSALREASGPKSMMRRVVDQALVLIPGAEGAVVELVDGPTMTYVCCAGSLSTAVGLQLDLATSLSGQAVLRSMTLRCDDATTDERVDRAACMKVGAISMICVPLLYHAAPVGVLKVSSSRKFAFDDDDVATLGALATFITTAITTASEMARATADVLAAQDGAPPSAAGTDRVVKTSRFMANVLAPGLSEDVDARRRVEDVLSQDDFDIVFQPEFDLQDWSLAAVEALTRFRPRPYRPPDAWFAEAARAGLGPTLEVAAVAKAIARAALLPVPCRVAVNIGPEALQHPDSLEVLRSIDPRRLIIELTEHVEVDDYPLLRRLLHALRSCGAALAVDDTGAGFASLSHIVKLAPDIIKLDMELVRGIDIDPVRRSLATAVVAFAADTGARVTAEGVETEAELQTLRVLGTSYGQGYLLGRPGPPEAVPLHYVSALTRPGLVE